jgi:hypothetical protein
LATSAPITTSVVSSNPAPSEAHWIQHHVIILVSDFQPVVFIIIFKKTKSIFSVLCILGDGVQHHFQQYFSHILAISFIGGETGEKDDRL